MKAASIALRIADFLQRHPPFEFLAQADLVSLAQAGRVKFHENDEVIFTEGQPRDRFIYVINQGRVRILEETAKGGELLDLRGPGELLGLQGILSDEPYINTGIAETDVLLYALPREAFVRLAENSPRARRYLAAYFSLNPAYDRQAERGERSLATGTVMPTTLRKGGLDETEPPQAFARESLVVVSGASPAIVAAIGLQSKRVQCVVVVDEAGRPIGKISDADLRDRFIEGRSLQATTAAEIMFTDLAFARPTDSTGKLLVRLTRSGKRFLIVTEDGTAATRAVGLVTERNIFLQYGRFPTLLGEALGEAANTVELRLLRDRMEALILEFLEDRFRVGWLMEMSGVLNRLLTARVLTLTERELEAEGWVRPRVAYTWLMMGSGGRDELLVRSAVYHALMYEDPAPEEAEPTARYYRELGHRAASGLRQCGFMESTQGILASDAAWCLPQSAMYERFTRMIAEPVAELVYTFRDAFDFRPVVHLCALASGLRAHINRELRAHPEFLRHMASDSLLNQPPRTLFQNYVIDEQGIQKAELAIKHHALLPLVDAGRVLALAAGDVTATATYRRFRHAASALGDLDEPQRRLYAEAAEAFLLLAFARTRQGLLHGTDGAEIRLDELDSETRTLLKTAFRTILGVLEDLASRYDLKMRA